MIGDVLRNCDLFIDGRGYAGKVEEMTPPRLTVRTEEHRAGGMDAPVELDMGLEKLECGFALGAIDAEVLKLWGLRLGARTPLTFRGALEDENGAVKAVAVKVRGLIKEIDYGSWKPGEKAALKAVVAVRYYRLEIDGQTIHEIDPENMVRVVNGIDQLALQRAALAR